MNILEIMNLTEEEKQEKSSYIKTRFIKTINTIKKELSEDSSLTIKDITEVNLKEIPSYFIDDYIDRPSEGYSYTITFKGFLENIGRMLENVDFNYDYIFQECINELGKLEDIEKSVTDNEIKEIFRYFDLKVTDKKDVVISKLNENYIKGNTIKLLDLTGLYTNFRNEVSFTGKYNHLDIFHKFFTAVIEGKNIGEVPFVKLNYGMWLGEKQITTQDQLYNSWLISFTPYKNGNLTLNIRPEAMSKFIPYLLKYTKD